MLASQYTFSYLNTTMHSMPLCRYNLTNLNTTLINVLHFVEHYRRYIHSLINKSLKKPTSAMSSICYDITFQTGTHVGSNGIHTCLIT